jgi:hypothetical protein
MIWHESLFLKENKDEIKRNEMIVCLLTDQIDTVMVIIIMIDINLIKIERWFDEAKLPCGFPLLVFPSEVLVPELTRLPWLLELPNGLLPWLMITLHGEEVDF